MYIDICTRNEIITRLSRLAVDHVTAVAEMRGDDALPPATYLSGYAIGYAHAIDDACTLIATSDSLTPRPPKTGLTPDQLTALTRHVGEDGVAYVQ